MPAIIALSLMGSANVSPTVSGASLPAPEVVVNTTDAGPVQNSYADVVSRVAPAVVTVRSESRSRATQQQSPFDDPAFREFFGDGFRGPQPRGPQRGIGSGVIVTQDGFILTNNHVVEGADTVTIELTDRRTFTAKVVGTDPPSDLAVLKIDARSLPVLPLGDSDRVRVGDVALAVGNPLGIGQTVTSGIISAKGRSNRGSGESFEDFIQTDAPINRGNSGGALVNTNGELIGINSQILSPTGGSIGIGFAIPSNMAKNVMDQLTRTGKVRRSQVGIGIQPVTADVAASLGLAEPRGILVSRIEPGSPAERAGIRRGDIVTALNGTPVNDYNSFRNQVANTQPGTQVTLTVNRDGREQPVRVTLVERTVDAARGEEPVGENGDAPGSGGRLGIRVEPLTPQLAEQLGLRGVTQGVVVRSVDPSGPMAEIGVQPGDVIEEINRQPVRSEADIATAIQRAGDRPLLMLINRRGQSTYQTVRPRR